MKLSQVCPGMHDVRNRTTVLLGINPFALLLTWTFISLSPFLVVEVIVWTDYLQFSPFAQ